MKQCFVRVALRASFFPSIVDMKEGKRNERMDKKSIGCLISIAAAVAIAIAAASVVVPSSSSSFRSFSRRGGKRERERERARVDSIVSVDIGITDESERRQVQRDIFPPIDNESESESRGWMGGWGGKDQ